MPFTYIRFVLKYNEMYSKDSFEVDEFSKKQLYLKRYFQSGPIFKKMCEITNLTLVCIYIIMYWFRPWEQCKNTFSD